MRVRIFAVISVLLLALCLLAWLRSYLPGNLYLRTYRGSLALIQAHPQWEREIELTSFMSGLRSQPASWGLHTVKAIGFEIIWTKDLEYGYIVVSIPFWALCLPLLVAAAWGVAAWRRQRERERPGRCRKCGYDLRGSTGTCPECGNRTLTGRHSRIA